MTSGDRLDEGVRGEALRHQHAEPRFDLTRPMSRHSYLTPLGQCRALPERQFWAVAVALVAGAAVTVVLVLLILMVLVVSPAGPSVTDCLGVIA